MMLDHKQMLADAYAALNRGDIEGFMAILDADVLRVEPPGFPLSGTYRGIKAVRGHFSQARNSWAEGSCTPKSYEAFDDKMIVHIEVNVRLKDQTEWIKGDVWDVFKFANGKVVEYYSFGSEAEAYT